MGVACSSPHRLAPARGVPVNTANDTITMSEAPVIIVTNSRDGRAVRVTFLPRAIEVISDGVRIDIVRSPAAANAIIDIVSHWYTPMLDPIFIKKRDGKGGVISIRTNFLRSLASAPSAFNKKNDFEMHATIEAGQTAPISSALAATMRAVNVGMAIRHLAFVS